jgi:hypothetical protein
VAWIEGPLGRVKYSVRDLIYPGHIKLVFFDNNILAPPGWREILEELVELGLRVDFNQGLDVRLLGGDAAELLSRMHIDPVVRLAYDARGCAARSSAPGSLGRPPARRE